MFIPNKIEKGNLEILKIKERTWTIFKIAIQIVHKYVFVYVFTNIDEIIIRVIIKWILQIPKTNMNRPPCPF